MFVILVRSNDIADMAVTVRFQWSAAGPESTRLEKYLGTSVAQKRLISSRLPVLPDRIGDVRANVLLLLAGEDIDYLTIRTDNLLRSGLSTAIGGLPSVEGAAPAHPCRFRPRRIEGAEAIHEQRAGGFRPSQDIKGQKVYLSVPEHVPMVIVAGQRAGSDRHALVCRIGGAIQMIDSEPQCLLCGGVAVDLDVAAQPATCPGRLVSRQYAAPAEVARNIKLILCPSAWVKILGVAPCHGDCALEIHNLSGA